ncbi:hypothetical protein ETSB_1375 [cyanobacterium endosymbiont of Epithemia turgida isolate EtSB Lake Yunoko]|nr:hypothetical protein ETSB_1375 [cyanobacterium endosymbiont of Epithemia turgida isolate EtSB Lake Yunoko]
MRLPNRKLFLEKGALVNRQRPPSGISALMLAAGG